MMRPRRSGRIRLPVKGEKAAAMARKLYEEALKGTLVEGIMRKDPAIFEAAEWVCEEDAREALRSLAFDPLVRKSTGWP